jgi:phospholipid transport system substrate-binding protein
MQISDSNIIGRRTFLGLAGGFTLSLVMGRSAYAISTSQAAELVNSVTNQVLALVNSGQSEAAVLSGFKTIFNRNADVTTIARTVMGRPWRTATDKQKTEFVAAYQDYLSNNYGRQFREYRGSSLSITNAKDQGQKGVLVNTSLKTPGKAPVAVDWQVIDRSGQPKVFDLYIEGVSMLITGRSEIGSMLEASGGNIDRVIAQLRSKA